MVDDATSSVSGRLDSLRDRGPTLPEGLLPDAAPEKLIRFGSLWLQVKGGRRVPDFSDLDPVMMPWALSTIFVVQRLAGGTFVFRLVGEQMNDRLGGGLTGKSAFQVFEERHARRITERWVRVLSEPALCFTHSRHVTHERRPLEAQRLLAPVRDGAGKIDRLVGLSAFDRGVSHPGIRPPGDQDIDVRWFAVDALPCRE